MPNISIHQQHDTFESHVCEVACQYGYKISDGNRYHATCDCGRHVIGEEAYESLKATYDPATLIVRTFPDTVAIHDSGSFFIECKTKDHPTRADVLFEALPFMASVYHADLGADCLYACYIKATDSHCGFWANHDSASMVSAVFVPGKYEKAFPTGYWQEKVDAFFPNADLVTLSRVSGSGDPFCRIDWGTHGESLPHWEELIRLRSESQNIESFDTGVVSID